MDSLADALELFNRKERNLVVRHILGHAESPLRLTASFRRTVAELVKLRSDAIPDDASWWTDYHFDWLAGALTVFMKGETASSVDHANRFKRDKQALIMGNQEDVDLVIAAGCQLFLIEAKAYGHFKKAQCESKLDRLELLLEYYNLLASTSHRRVEFHVLSLSPSRSARAKQVHNWPRVHALGDETISNVDLPLGDLTKKRVTRWDCEKGMPSGASAATAWRIVPEKNPNEIEA
jgi:hypothetical protein